MTDTRQYQPLRRYGAIQHRLYGKNTCERADARARTRRFAWRIAGAALAVAFGWSLTATGTQAQESYPKGPIKILVPYPAGGLPDTVARIVGEKLQSLLGVPASVENRAGAFGSLAVAGLMSVPADGQTIMVTEGSILYNSLIIRNLAYDWRALLPAAQLARSPQFLAVNARIPVTTVEEFAAYARSTQNKLNYGSAGVGSPHHLAMEAVKSGLKLDLVHVPFKGSNESVPALVGGHIDVLWSAYPAIAGFVNEKKVRLLATNSPQRSEQAPHVPPMGDSIDGFNTASLVGIFVRAGTPESIVEKLSQAAVAATQDPQVRQKLLIVGVEPAGLGSAQFISGLAAERERIGKIVTEAKISAN